MKKKILVHICCAPCFIAPQKHLKAAGWEIHGFWYNHNIHPFLEYNKRLITLQNFAAKAEIPLIIKAEYDLEKFLRNSAFRESTRCYSCYYERLKYCAIVAKKGNFDAFSTTLLYSKYQNHQMIKEIGKALAKEYKVDFYYEDFRQYWQEGIDLSKADGMYRQQYCGCIYSEHERYKNVRDIAKEIF
ncbi:MAG: epoxyqueuosine reductase QueH [Candidatus Cloacimonadales bacterium]